MNDDLIFDSFKKLYESQTTFADYNGVFIKDGIVNKTLFGKPGEKILFIAKEHNLPKDYEKKKETYAADYRIWWEHYLNSRFSIRISEWAHGIKNNFETNFDDIDDVLHRQAALRSIAFINVKKTAGRANANATTIWRYIGASRTLLLQQISEIAPTLIVCGFRYDNYPDQLFGPSMKKSESGTFSTGTWAGIDIINFFHPSCRKDPKWLYEELGKAHKVLRSG